MSYDQLKDHGNNPPSYPYPSQQGASNGYQLGPAQPEPGVLQQDLPDTNSTYDQNQFREDEGHVAASVSVAHLNVSRLL